MSLFSTKLLAILGAALVCALPAASDVAISVRECGAIGDGKADDTAAFRKAIQQAREAGARVAVPKGSYRITGVLELKAQSLVGEVAGAWGADELSLPQIVLAGNESGFRLLAGGSVHGLLLNHDWQGNEPEQRAPSITLAGVGCRVSDVKIFGAWDAIWADPNTNPARSMISNIFIVNVHNVGIGMAGTYDVTWISNVEVWSPGSKLFPKSGVGFLLGKNDMLLISNCFAFTAHTGFKLIEDYPGIEKPGGTWGTLTNCNTDFCSVGVEIVGKHSVSFAGGTYWNHWHGMIVKGSGAEVRVSGIELGANGGPALWVDGGKVVAVSGCQIRRTAQGFDAPALKITGGESMALSGCVISSSTKGIEQTVTENVAMSGNVVRENVKE